MAAKLTETRLRQWMQKLGPQLIALSAGICRDRHQAEEIVQEAFIKLWRKPPDAGEIAYPSWMRRVVTNLSINAIQRTKRPAALPVVESDRALCTQSNPETGLVSDESMGRIGAAMQQLDPMKRAILLLRAREQLTYEQIAEHLGIPVGTVMSRLNRARAALMEVLEQTSTPDEQPEVYEFKRYSAG